ncbi:O-antigen ligase family protein [Brumimicrobium oceani]|uniref:O-antigen ligase-related domain-containing protein n=1 Tax=Brumimicrobium oceani TaxID=2100725 RepID=A0A2U2XCZ5_9FLAO|nr:O-antigen ligase family protein [Brumimicrobium oceani]PWH85581.1 hypothetical protein DIT68_08040 [Brumimicrobium oceani]
MLNRFFGPKIHDNINVFAVFVLAIGIPVSKVVMSLGTLILAVNFLLNADFKSYWEKSKKNLVFWFVILVLVFHLLGLLYTTDYAYAFRDLKTKLPLFAIPIVMIGYPLKKWALKYVFYGFLAAVLITSVLNYIFMLKSEINDYREISHFGSHIRYALLVVTGVLLSIYLLFQQNKPRWVFVLLIIWFLYYTLISQVFSGYIAALLLLIACFLYFVKTIQNTSLKIVSILALVTVATFGAVQMINYLVPEKPLLNFGNLPTHSKNGEKYYNDTNSLWFENGHHILSQIAGDELKKAWNERSDVDYTTELASGYELNQILIRYMASKGLTKDKEGMLLMSAEDIENVENGMVNIRETYGVFQYRISGLKNEVFHYAIGGDPDGNSLLQRFEHWKAGKEIIKNNCLTGVGTGDLQIEFDQAYRESNTQLDEMYWNRAHNQFMTFWISFGIVAFVIFSGFWLWFLWKNIKLNNFIGIGFSLMAIGSFMSEDTIETQQGVTYIAFFLGLITLMNSWRKKAELEIKNEE